VKNTIFLLFIISITSFGIVSCKKNKNQDNEPEFYIKAKFNGTEKIFINATGKITHGVDINNNPVGDALSADADDNTEGIELGLAPYTGDGTYTLGGIEDSTIGYGKEVGNQYQVYFSQSGTMTIQVSSDRFEGTFSTTIIDDDTNEVIEVTDGKFVVKRQPDQTEVIY